MGNQILGGVKLLPLLTVFPKHELLILQVYVEVFGGQCQNDECRQCQRYGFAQPMGYVEGLDEEKERPDVTGGTDIEIVVPKGMAQGDGKDEQHADGGEQPVSLEMEEGYDASQQDDE